MSKQGVNTTPSKQDNNSFKKDNRNQNSGLNINVKEERRSGGFNSTPGNQQGRGGGQNQNNSNQNNQQHDRDRSSNRNENKQFDNKPVTETEKTADKDDKNVEGSTGGTGPAPGEKKFTGRCRLFVGNLTPDVTESDFRKMFEPFGEIAEVYVNTSRGFGFIRLDYRQNAEAAKAALDGHQRKGRILRVRFATHGAALKVKNLHPYVSNELLEQSFSQFGELERCVVIVDDRGKPTGEGIVEFVRKPGANSALRRINEGVFLMGIDPKPVAVEPLEQKDEEDGMPEKFLTKTDQYKKEREKEPRFAPPGTFEYEFGMRWKALEDLEKQRIEQIKKDTEEARLKLEDEMQNALYEYQAEQIRQDLLRQQEELRRLEELRKQDRMRRQQEMELRRQQDDRERAQQEERRRTDMMLSMRQQELARGRGPLDSRGRDDILMADRYGDRMSDRMPDRMGDRMSDRIGDRMGPGQSGFMWDDNQRGEAGMRGDGGRGRDMRGSGAPPLQPPPVPPSGPGALERGGQSMAASAQSSKSSPKPLMGTSGFGNIGNQPGNAPGANNPSASSDNSNMADEDVNEESICSINDAESQNIVTPTENDLENSRLDIPPVSLKVEGEDVHQTIEKCQLPTNNFSPDLNEGEHPGLWSAPTHYKDGSMDESENIPSSRPPVVLPLDKDRKDNTIENPTKKPRCDYDFNTSPSEQTPCDFSTSKSLCFSTPRNNTFFVGNSSSELSTKLNSKSKENCMDEPEMDIDETYLDGTHSKDKIDPGGRVKPPLQRYLSADDVSDEQTVPKEFKIQRYLSADNMDLTSVQSYLSNDIVPVECSSLHSNESYQSIDTLHISESNSYKPSDVPSQYTSSDAQSITETSNSDHSYKNVQKLCNTSGDYVTSHTDTLDFKLPPSLHVDIDSNNSCSDYNQVLEEYNSTYEAAADSNNYKQTVPSEDSPISDYNQSDVNLISYKQTCSEDVSDMDTEGLDESTAQTTDSPGIYQSYEEGISSHYGSAALNSLIGVPGVAEYNTSATSEENWVSSGSGDSNAAVISNSEVPSNSYLSSSSFTDTQNTLTVASTSSMSATVTSTQNKVSGVSKDDHEGALCTGDQSFKTAAARQSAMGPFLQASRSVPFVPSINPSIYAGTAMVQGIPGPTIMSTSSVHIQHPNGATIMRQQTVSAGLNGGGITQATLMQQQAMANGAQATAVLQQRTMTNRGQTMVLQQRTINTGLGAMTQQTLVQQRLAAPNNVAQAMFQANALRHRAMVSQQATLLQQRAIRLAQARAMGTQLMRAQALRGAALLQQAAVGTQPSMLSQGLVRTASPAAVMQQLVRQRYLGGPVMPGRGVQMVAGRPVRVKLTYTRETLPMESNT